MSRRHHLRKHHKLFCCSARWRRKHRKPWSSQPCHVKGGLWTDSETKSICNQAMLSAGKKPAWQFPCHSPSSSDIGEASSFSLTPLSHYRRLHILRQDPPRTIYPLLKWHLILIVQEEVVSEAWRALLVSVLRHRGVARPQLVCLYPLLGSAVQGHKT